MIDEVVVVKLPLSVEAVAAIGEGLGRVWPDSYVEPFDGPEMHVVLAGEKVEPEEMVHGYPHRLCTYCYEMVPVEFINEHKVRCADDQGTENAVERGLVP